MDAPTIRYAITKDGVSIAYAVSGSGPVLISVPSPPDNHVQLEWHDDERRASVEGLARYRTVVRFDGRGTGLSDRQLSGFSMEERLLDMEAVLERTAGGVPVTLLTGAHGTQLAVAFAVAHPERVGHLITVNPIVRGSDFLSPEQLNMWQGMLQTDYRMFTEAMGSQIYGWGNEQAARFGAFFRECVTAETALRIYDSMLPVDVSDLLPRVQCPVLVLRTASSGFDSPTAPAKFAALLPNATVVFADARPVEGATVEMRRHIAGFLGEDWPEPEPAKPAAHGHAHRDDHSLRILLFTDIEGHTTMMSRLGDADGRQVLREHERITREALASHGGSEVKSMGDGFMASFGSAQRALECAAALQSAMSHDDSALSGAGLRVRVGINAGEPIAEDDDLFGASVITAARIAAKAEGGQVLVANVVRELVAGKGFLFSDTGEHVLKGMEEPVRVWELRWRD